MKGPRPFELHEICYVDLHYDRRCCVRREIIFQTISFCGPKYEGVQLTHNNTRLTYLAPLVNYFTYDPFFEVNGSSSLSENVWERTTTTAWPFLKIVRPEDTCDGLGIEYCGKRIWEMFWTPQDRIDASPRKCPE